MLDSIWIIRRMIVVCLGLLIVVVGGIVVQMNEECEFNCEHVNYRNEMISNEWIAYAEWRKNPNQIFSLACVTYPWLIKRYSFLLLLHINNWWTRWLHCWLTKCRVCGNMSNGDGDWRYMRFKIEINSVCSLCRISFIVFSSSHLSRWLLPWRCYRICRLLKLKNAVTHTHNSEYLTWEILVWERHAAFGNVLLK